MSKVRTAAALSALLLLFVSCGSDDGDSTTNGSGDADAGGDAAVVEVSAFDFGFEPTTISLDAGEEVTFSFDNTGDAPHTFTAEDLDVDIRTEGGGDGEISVTAPEDGTYGFVCSIHPDRMTGEIIVGTGGGGAGDDGTTEGEAENDDGVDY